MKAWQVIMAGVLACSLALNLYFFTEKLQPNQQKHEKAKTPSKMSQPQQATVAPNSRLPAIKRDKVENNLLQNKSPNREQLLAQAHTWLKNNDQLALEGFLQNYLKQHPLDIEFLLIEAQLKVKTSLLSDAINYYYDLLRFPMSTAQFQLIQQEIERLTSTTIKQLSENYSWELLARFVEPLLQLEPSNRLFILTLAQAYAELYQTGLMENVLASLPYDDPDAHQIRQIVNTQQLDPVDQSTDSDGLNAATRSRPIGLKRIGDHFTVQASLTTNPVTLLVDTGASVTAVSRAYFRQLSNRYKINYMGRFIINTAGGRVMAPMYQFSQLTIQHVSVENIAVVVLPMQAMTYADGLLGMNFLREFDFKIDQTQSVLFLD